MRAIIPTQEIEKTGKEFPLTGNDCAVLCSVLSMELFGSSLAEVARQINGTVEDVQAICTTEDYIAIRNTVIENVRKLDQKTLSGRIVREASGAFDRIVELSRDDDVKADVRLMANQDILNRSMINNVASQADELTITFKKRG